MYKIIVKSHFDAAHWLKNYDGDCSNLHGHTWYVEVCCCFEDFDLVNGMAIDFKEIKLLINSIIPDHKCLNVVFEFNPTAENIAKWLSDQLLEKGVRHDSITVWESLECAACYFPNKN